MCGLRNDMLKNLFLWLIIAVILILVVNNFGPQEEKKTEFTYSQLMSKVKDDKIKSVKINKEAQKISGETKNGEDFYAYLPMNDPALLKTLSNKDVQIQGTPPEKPSFLRQIFIYWFPFLLLIAFWIYIFRQQMGGGKGGGGAFSFGRSKAKMHGEDQVKVTFADVAGCDEAKDEVLEVVDFLKEPMKFQKLGGKIPRGLMLVGPPGTGKTLLAKAVAGEAKVPFFSISGSDFVEMFVGVGASRVRDMFEQAKKQAPCIIFIDEMDAVGRQRGAGLGGGHDEREQTLNQLLVEMDGFAANEGVIVVAATNRPDVLDPALLRPGRFDRQIVVNLPDIKGRSQILSVHAKQIPIEESVDLEAIARGTPGFSGADLANLVNEATLFAARSDKKSVDMGDFERAKDKIIMGAERSSMVMSEDDKRLTAYHEAGHAIVGLSVPDHDPVHKVTIIPRGRALGVTMFLPEKDRYSYTKRQLHSQLCSLYGGRLAESLIFGDDNVTTGASNDIQRATEISRNMVTKWGLSEQMGPLVYQEDDDQVFLGHSMGRQNSTIMSEETALAIDNEVRRIAEDAYKTAKQILTDKINILHAMAEALVKYETITEGQIDDLMNERPVREPEFHQTRETNLKTKPSAYSPNVEEKVDSSSQENQHDQEGDEQTSEKPNQEGDKQTSSKAKNKSNEKGEDKGDQPSSEDEQQDKNSDNDRHK